MEILLGILLFMGVVISVLTTGFVAVVFYKYINDVIYDIRDKKEERKNKK